MISFMLFPVEATAARKLEKREEHTERMLEMNGVTIMLVALLLMGNLTFFLLDRILVRGIRRRYRGGT